MSRHIAIDPIDRRGAAAGIPGSTEVVVLSEGRRVPAWVANTPSEGVVRILLVGDSTPSPSRPERTIVEHMEIPVIPLEAALEALR